MDKVQVTDLNNLNKRQRASVELILESIYRAVKWDNKIANNLGLEIRYEVKEQEITQFPDTPELVFIYIAKGIANDEGTLASVFCQDRYLLMIRKGGAIDLLNAKDNRRKNGPAITKRVQHYNFVHSATR